MSNNDLPLVDASVEFYESIRRRLIKLSSGADSSESALADAAINALAPLRCERDLRAAYGVFADDWNARVAETYELAAGLAAKVEAEDERDYLRRLLIEATSDLIPATSELWDKALALLAEISDADERQLATYALAVGMAKRLPELAHSDAEPRRQTLELVDALEDNDEFERALGYALAGTRASIERLAGDELESARQTWRDEDLDRFCVDATIEGVVRYFNEIAPEFAVRLEVSRVEPALLEAWNGLKETLGSIEKGVETGVLAERTEEGIEESELDDDEVEELEFLLSALEITNPLAANFGEETRAFVERRQAFGTIEKQLERVNDALETLESDSGDAAFELARALYCRDRAYYESERGAWLELGEKFARADGLSYSQKAERLTRLAYMQFKYGEKELGRAAVRDVLEIVPKLEGTGHTTSCLKGLVQIHLELDQMKPAARLAALLDEKISALTETLMSDHHRSEAFALYIQVFDAERLEEALSSFASHTFQTSWRAKRLVAKAFVNFNERGDEQALRQELEEAADYLEETQEDDPFLAAAALRDLAEYTAELAKQRVFQQI